VLLPATSLRADVVLGALILAGLLVVLVRAARPLPWAALAAGWLVLTILPVSNLLFPVGTMLAERTLYLPSVAAALAAGGTLELLARTRPARLRLAWGVAFGACALLLARTVTRNPTWMDSLTFMRTLAREHPESVTVYRGRAAALVQRGDTAGAQREYDGALALMPNDYNVLTEAGALYKRERRFADAERLLTNAVRVAPDRPAAYRLLAELYLMEGDGRRAHAVALAGLAHWGADHDLWALVSESYVAKGDLEGAVRAREAASAQDPGRASDRARLAELLAAESRFAASRSRP
jgi:tetratricopeptide (TPR) repeat protein